MVRNVKEKIIEMIERIGTPEAVAATIGVSLRTVNNWAREKQKPIYSLQKAIDREYEAMKTRAKTKKQGGEKNDETRS